jgi:hypothetical protein
MNADRPSPNSSRATESRKTGTSFEASVDRMASATRSCTPEKSPPKRGGKGGISRLHFEQPGLGVDRQDFPSASAENDGLTRRQRLIDWNSTDGLAFGDDAELFRRRKHGVEIVTGRNPFAGLAEHQRPVRSHLEQRSLGARHRLEQFSVERLIDGTERPTFAKHLPRGDRLQGSELANYRKRLLQEGRQVQARRTWRLAPFLHEQIDHGDGLHEIQAQLVGRVQSTAELLLGMYIRSTAGLPARRPDLPSRCRSDATDHPGPTWATLSTSPISMPSSSVDVATAVVGLGSSRSLDSTSSRSDLARFPWWAKNSFGRRCISAISLRRSVKISTFRREPPTAATPSTAKHAAADRHRSADQ